MISSFPLRRFLATSALGISMALFGNIALQAQTTASPADYAAAAAATNVSRHALRAMTPAGQAMSAAALHTASTPLTSAVAPPDSGGPRYPADLEYLGGAVVVSMESHAIYLFAKGGTCKTIAGCWGNPQGFLRDYGKSDMIHIVDQYTGSTANNRYTVAEDATHVNYTPPAKPFTDADMQALVHAVVVSSAEDHHYQTGYGHEYHIFLPPGQDECFDSTFTQCYSPDNPNSFVFCAYHNSMDFSDIGHVLYSVEPFQNVPGCNVRPGTPNGQVADSTNNSLSHELTETITDPDGSAWLNFVLVALFTAEIGDECSFELIIPNPNPPPQLLSFFDPSNVTLNGNKYAIQPEYNNADHACTTKP